MYIQIRDQRKADGAKNKMSKAGKKQKEGDVSFNSSSASAAGRMHRLQNQSMSTTTTQVNHYFVNNLTIIIYNK